jgi:hypothetical protein
MAEKRTKADKMQRNVERLATRDEARRESQINEQRSEAAGATELEERIRLRAYELYDARGREDGHELDDWLQAEAEIRPAKRKATAA